MISQVEISAQQSRMNDLSLDELRQALAFCYRHIADQEQQVTDLESDNHQLRLQVADLEDELQRREEERDRFKKLIDWLRDLLANRTIPTAVKLTLFHFWFVFFMMRNEQTGNEMRIGVEAAAAALGCDKGTVKKATDKAEQFGLLTRRYEPITTSSGDKITLAHITLHDAVSKPDQIVMEKTHGGKRTPQCPQCGSDNVDRYTVQYCRHCNENDWYVQPGTRSDAPYELAQAATNRAVYGKGQKQDAFQHQEIEEPCSTDEQKSVSPASMVASSDVQSASTAHSQAARSDSSPSQVGTIKRSAQELEQPRTNLETVGANSLPKTTSKKQDAFDQAHHVLPSRPAQLAAEHTHNKGSKLQPPSTPLVVKERKVVCHAAIALNKDGKAVQAMVNGHSEKIASYQECGSSRWQWSDNDGCAVCASCWTPMPIGER